MKTLFRSHVQCSIQGKGQWLFSLCLFSKFQFKRKFIKNWGIHTQRTHRTTVKELNHHRIKRCFNSSQLWHSIKCVCVCMRERERERFFFKRGAGKRVSVIEYVNWERSKYVDECGLSHPQTNQQPLGNKNVLSVIVNYKYWSSPYCSLLIMLNSLPLTIMKPLTHCVSVCTCMCVYMCVREKVSMPAYLRKYAIVF